MEIKNFLFLLLILNFLTGCQLFQQRHNEPIVISQNQNPNEATPGVAPTPGKVLPVGIFLGPGALRSYAHVGVLKAFQQAHIPVVAIGGHEWGAVVASYYAFSKSSNAVEWQMLKLRKDQIASHGFLSQEVSPKDSESFLQYLKFTLADKNLETTKIPFYCFTTDGNQNILVSTGKAWDAVAKCASFPPLYNKYVVDGVKWGSSAGLESDWVEPLKKAGAEFFVYVDVLSEPGQFAVHRYLSQETLTTLWAGVKSLSNYAQRQASMVIQTGIDNDFLDFNARREMIKKGELIGNNALPALKMAIGLAP